MITKDLVVDGNASVTGDLRVGGSTLSTKKYVDDVLLATKEELATKFGLTSTKTDNAIVRFDGTTGKIQNSGITIDDTNTLSSDGYYLKKDTVSVNGANKNREALVLYGSTYGNIVNDIKTAGKLSWGDGGPQIIFNTKKDINDSSCQPLALIYTDHDGIEPGVSLTLATNSVGVRTNLVADVFKGSLKGNADTATKATQDGNGSVITNTYATKVQTPKFKYFGSPSGKTCYIKISTNISNYFNPVFVNIGYDGSVIFVGNGSAPVLFNSSYGFSGYSWVKESGSDYYNVLWLRITNYGVVSVTIPSVPNSSGLTISDWTTTAPSGITFTAPSVKFLKSSDVATASTLGGVRLGSDTVQTTAANGVSTTSSRTYAVQKNSNNQLVVNVPWTNTVYTLPAATASTLGGVRASVSGTTLSLNF